MLIVLFDREELHRVCVIDCGAPAAAPTELKARLAVQDAAPRCDKNDLHCLVALVQCIVGEDAQRDALVSFGLRGAATLLALKPRAIARLSTYSVQLRSGAARTGRKAKIAVNVKRVDVVVVFLTAETC